MLPHLVTARVSISQQWFRKVALWCYFPYSARPTIGPLTRDHCVQTYRHPRIHLWQCDGVSHLDYIRPYPEMK